MKLSCFSSGLLLPLLPLFIAPVCSAPAAPRAAFYYGSDFSPAKMSFYDTVTIQPENISDAQLSAYKEKLFAYLSVGERKEKIKNSWILSSNPAWGTSVADIRKKEYRDYLFSLAGALSLRGFRNFFLDTLDSYQVVLKKPEEKKAYEEALALFIRELRKRNPSAKIMLNRGFELLPAIASEIDAVAAESLYSGIIPQTGVYVKKNQEDSVWLKNKMKEVLALKKQAFIIDYLPPEKEEERIALARKIYADGFTPYVTDYELKSWGQSVYELIKRKILILYDASRVPDLIYSQAHRLVSMPLEYLGYIPEIRDINSPLPDNTRDYAGIVVNLENNIPANYTLFNEWITKQIKSGEKVLFLDYFGFPLSTQYLAPLGLNLYRNLSKPEDTPAIGKLSSYASFEMTPAYRFSEFFVGPENIEPAVEFKNSKGQKIESAAITPWGGFALDGAWVITFDGNELLPLDPFIFFKKALRLRDFPVPDATTENGRRILFAHLDGDGFIDKYEPEPSFYSPEIIKREILEKYRIPHSVSVIQGEIDNPSLTEAQKEKFKNIARGIFALENVEIANHSYSHPFKWANLKYAGDLEHPEGVYGLSINGYIFSLEKEIAGSKKWIDENLAPPGKKNDIFFWTGDCVPPETALKMAAEAGMLNLNGGYTAATKSAPYLSMISPMGIKRGEYYQVFSAEQNENIYTNLWTGPFWGFSEAVQTFELTDKPRRLKPEDIYYHFYSGSKTSSLNALKKVYDYALDREHNLFYASEYAEKVLDFYSSEIYNLGSEWVMAGSENLKTLRTGKDLFPDISGSVAGYYDYNDARYLHLYGTGLYSVKLSSAPPSSPYLQSANGVIKEFAPLEKGLYLKLESREPLTYSLGNVEKCLVKEERKKEKEFRETEINVKCR